METFHFTVLTIAIVFFIIIIISFSILLSYKKNNILVYPTTKNTCPDYWNVSVDVSGCIIDDRNTGNIVKDASGNYILSNKGPLPTYGFDGASTINFSDPSWSSGYVRTNQCALKLWSNQNNISWDGVSNYNSC